MRPSSLFPFKLRGTSSRAHLRRTDNRERHSGRLRMGDVMTEMRWQGTATGLLIGIGFGVALGMLLAPKSGKDARRQITGAVRDGLDGAISKGQNLTRSVQQTLDDARERVKDAAEAGEQAYRGAKSIAS